MLNNGWKRIARCIAAGLPWFACLAPGLLNAQNAKPNVLVLVLDQLRADELHCYGNPRQTSPNIDKLASRGVVLSHYYTARTVDFALLWNAAYLTVPFEAWRHLVLDAGDAIVE